MAAFYVDEEEVGKCPKHPSKRHRSGICPTCLRDRLSSLCPDCATVRPCSCCAVTTSPSSSSSSSFSRFSFSGREIFGTGIGSVGRVSNLIESEPSFRRSRSVALPFVGSKSKLVEKMDTVGNEVKKNESRSRKTTTSFWWWLRGSKREGEVEVEVERKVMMRKSRSVAVTTSDYGKSKGTKWYFPSPIKAFRQTRLSKVVVQQHSPMHRG
ncbi:hypothetical protein ACOSQ2_000040 [Xanthoceras sorbifolium]